MEGRTFPSVPTRTGKTTFIEKRFEGPLVVQKPLYPEGDEVVMRSSFIRRQDSLVAINCRCM